MGSQGEGCQLKCAKYRGVRAQRRNSGRAGTRLRVVELNCAKYRGVRASRVPACGRGPGRRSRPATRADTLVTYILANLPAIVGESKNETAPSELWVPTTATPSTSSTLRPCSPTPHPASGQSPCRSKRNATAGTWKHTGVAGPTIDSTAHRNNGAVQTAAARERDVQANLLARELAIPGLGRHRSILRHAVGKKGVEVLEAAVPMAAGACDQSSGRESPQRRARCLCPGRSPRGGQPPASRETSARAAACIGMDRSISRAPSATGTLDAAQATKQIPCDFVRGSNTWIRQLLWIGGGGAAPATRGACAGRIARGGRSAA